MAGIARTDMGLSGASMAARSLAAVDIDNYFYLAGGSTGTAVDAVLTLGIDGQLHWRADAEGLALMRVAARLALYSTDPRTGVQDELIAHDELSVERLAFDGRDSRDIDAVLTLDLSDTLTYGTEYYLLAVIESETLAAMPLPGSLGLVLFGIGLGATLQWSRVSTRDPGH